MISWIERDAYRVGQTSFCCAGLICLYMTRSMVVRRNFNWRRNSPRTLRGCFTSSAGRTHRQRVTGSGRLCRVTRCVYIGHG